MKFLGLAFSVCCWSTKTSWQRSTGQWLCSYDIRQKYDASNCNT